MSKIASIKAREILASGASPSLEVKVILKSGVSGVASVSYGASAGIHEAHVLLDKGKRYNGKGMLKAVNNINKLIAPKLVNHEPIQRKCDHIMIDLDGTHNKEKLGANAILGVSLAIAKARAKEMNLPFYKYIRKAFNIKLKGYKLPNPMMVVIEGGKHADNSTDLQEFMISPVGAKNKKEAVRYGIETYHQVKKILKKKGLSTNVGNEGAFAPSLPSNEAPLKILVDAIKAAGFKPGKDIGISLDPASSEIFENNKYQLTKDKKKLSSEQMIDYYDKWVKKYPIITLEDPLHEDDWDNWPKINKRLGKKIAIVGDDLTVTNPLRLGKAIHLKAINAILIKLNQIGSLTETVETCMLAHKCGLMNIVSHRGGGETNDTSMVDLAVAVNASFIKVGPARGERVCKYNRLMEIEDEL